MLRRPGGLAIIVLLFLLLPVCVRGDSSDRSSGAGAESMGEDSSDDDGLSLLGLHVYWKDRLHADGARENLKLEVGGRLMLDAGNIVSRGDLGSAFPDLEGGWAGLRRARIDLLGSWLDALEWEFEMEFANTVEIKDAWIAFRRVPILGRIRLGHMKEPFSLERLTSSKHITFMERSIPTEALAPGRNMGILSQGAIQGDRLSWAAGGFVDVGAKSGLQVGKDGIDRIQGFSVTGRVTGLPVYEGEGQRLVHLGLGYTHEFRDGHSPDSVIAVFSRPESFISQDTLVDSGSIAASGVDLFNLEAALVWGPLSLQGEHFHAFTTASMAKNPQFLGGYLMASYFLTGEHRQYDRANGVFTQITPLRDFLPWEGGWGALELAARFSYLDLNDRGIRGGRETNLTLGLNWYLNQRVRLMTNYVHAWVEDRATPRVEGGEANIFQTRFQVVF